MSVFTGTKGLINDTGRGKTSHRTAALAIASSIALHWIAVQWINVNATTPQLPRVLNAQIIDTLAVNPPEHHRLAEPFLDSDQSAAAAETPQIPAPTETINRTTFNTGNALTAPAYYFRHDEIDVPAEPVSKPVLIFPERAFISRLSGKVRVRVFINETGSIDGLDVVETTPYHQPFTDSAIATLKATVFTPALIGGRRVKSQKLVEVVFNADEDAIAEPAPSSAPSGLPAKAW